MKYIMIILVFTLSNLALAQPDRVIIHSDGRIELVPGAAHPEELATGELTPIPVFTKQPDGTLTPGVAYRGVSEGGHHHKDNPGGIIRRADGTYEIEMYTWSVHHGPKGRHWERKIPGSDFAEVYDAVSEP